MDDHQISKDMHRGQQARELLEHPLLLEAFAIIEQEYFNIWKTSPPNQPQLREDSYHLLKGIERLKRTLEEYLLNGKVAMAELEVKSKQEQKKRSRLV